MVPVGADQKQNIEISRDLALRFNQTYCPDAPIFPVPEPLILADVAVVPGIDGRKMSKSYGNTIGIFEEGKTLKKSVMAIVTDSTPLEDPKDPSTCNVMALFRLFADADEVAEWESRYRQGGTGYGHAKKRLLALVSEHFEEARDRRRALADRPSAVEEILVEGGRRARRRAEMYMERVRDAVGLSYVGAR